METRRQVNDRRLQEVGIVFAKIELAKLIRQAQLAAVGNVEEIGDEAYSRVLVDHPRIIRVQIELREKRRPTEFPTTTNRNFTGIQINRMRQIFADRDARFHVETETEIQPVQVMPVHVPAILTKAVAAVNVRNEAAIRVQRSDSKLIAEQVELSGREVEERTDSGIRLSVVVAQVTF